MVYLAHLNGAPLGFCSPRRIGAVPTRITHRSVMTSVKTLLPDICPAAFSRTDRLLLRIPKGRQPITEDWVDLDVIARGCTLDTLRISLKRFDWNALIASTRGKRKNDYYFVNQQSTSTVGRSGENQELIE